MFVQTLALLAVFAAPSEDVVKALPKQRDAVIRAAEHIATIPEEDRIYYRYVWVPTGSRADCNAVFFAANTAMGFAKNVHKTTTYANDSLCVFDLRKFAVKEDDLVRLLKTWEEFNDEPYFYVKSTEKELVDVPGGFEYTDPKTNQTRTYYKRWAEKDVSTFSALVNLEAASLLLGATGSTVPIVSYNYFIVTALTTQNDGLYYKLQNIRKSDDPKLTDLEFFFKQYGANAVLTEERGAGSVLTVSEVTDSPRRIDTFRSQGGRADSSGIATLSYDIATDNEEVESHVILNLADALIPRVGKPSKVDAFEVIIEKSDGMMVYGAFNNVGDLQDFVPDNIARDFRVPAPGPTRLEPAISCIRCHAADDGFKTISNHYKNAVEDGYLNIFDDEAFALQHKTPEEALDFIAGKYSADMNKVLERARFDFNDATFRISQGFTVVQASQTVGDIHLAYIKRVTPVTALRELGYVVDEEHATKFLQYLLGVTEVNRKTIRFEDGRIGYLASGVPIRRLDWEAIYQDVALRALQTELQAQQKQENVK